jgi:2'-5' RNA ligase
MAGDRIEPAGQARLFIALWPGHELRDALEAWCGSWHWPETAKRIPPERLHLTLHFLGEVPRERLPALREALRLPFAPFTLSLGWPAVWPGGIAVLEADRSPPRLRVLHASLGATLQSLSLPVETRRFRPHLTIARRARTAVAPSTGPRLQWPVRGYALVESRRQPGGGYVILQHYP